MFSPRLPTMDVKICGCVVAVSTSLYFIQQNDFIMACILLCIAVGIYWLHLGGNGVPPQPTAVNEPHQKRYVKPQGLGYAAQLARQVEKTGCVYVDVRTTRENVSNPPIFSGVISIPHRDIEENACQC